MNHHHDSVRVRQGFTMKRIFLVLSLLALALTAVPCPAAPDDGALQLPPYKKVKLPNGMTLMLMERHQVPLISFSFLVKAGSVADPAGKEGVASLAATLLTKGTKTRTADQISADLDFIGGTLEANATLDFTGGAAEFLKKDIKQGLDLMTDALMNPTFPQDEFEKLVKQRIDGIKAGKDEAQGVLGTYFSAYFYGNHPYGRPVGGDEKSLAAITREDVVKFYEAQYTAPNMIMAVAGDFNTAEMERMLNERFAAWPAKAAPAIALPEPSPVQGKRLLLVDKPDSTQTFYQIGNLGISRTNPDRVFIEVVNTLFGGRFTSMLNTELRIKTGLTYGARSRFAERKVPGPFVISSFTANPTTEKALDMTLEVLNRLHEKGISEQELKSAKTYIKGQFPPTIETTDQLAGQIASLEFYGLDASEINTYYAKIDSMTLADAQRVIKQYYPQNNLAFVLIGKAEEIQKVAGKYAPHMDNKKISQPGF
ncbi:MAG: Insulinase-like protein [Pedosphaera sp.]|nr:Insulinase-like protein [Pedosphaera sp.]